MNHKIETLDRPGSSVSRSILCRWLLHRQSPFTFIFTIFECTLNLSISVDDSFLQRAVGSIPKGAILLIEDIDCAFSSREDEDEDDADRRSMPFLPFPMGMGGGRGNRRSAVTLSGLLNVLDGVGSEEGRIFFATVSYLSHAINISSLNTQFATP